ncbi:MAG: Valyl-tRNA synthetase [Parcubacteria group bacterium GW2011_GWC1_43_11b]|uniref:Valine--tRNA ligase n=1 Tax=Candidatus Vogelbacteria bacterium RIFOXYB1_FULL_42_16 TaxID=1802436 RepID=A0A1G2QDJ1_9BACT|nr:MAG: Valyl-tRNA synthetase [Parcubacteria group bacterium GW2011_GWB1_42_9]KKS89543.1 MAG: Valyl-tRNA synthetase [Parcubacteria group bacterium GW2011_GWC1_43_11b]KKT09861.1 MAG: Valyl-tRNA synthetase [Parcubacteria group bacterium GW2011_GWA1_43_21]OHA58159.1 MAG: valine--tRNA ligase [Candidatus Vogelbacteria bacterium RIFOXYB1_FULL_42_16]
MDPKLEKPYNPADTESRIYDLWQESGFFQPENLSGDRSKPFTIIMPPPNANGHLHAGHALFVTIEDLMIRYKRMRGFKTLWLPGADHAGFETQVVYEKKLEKEGRSRFGMDRQKLYDEIMAFTLENKKYMEAELKALGASCDWSREKFTLDPAIIKTVYGTFQQLYDDDLIYRGKRLVNWCTKHQTSLSDLETSTETRIDKLYYLQYGPLVVATVRPETMFGDVAVAVNPDDERYQQYIDQDIEVQTPIGSMKLKVVADPIVEKDFGTGALKITPAHDQNDFDLAKRHNLPAIEVIDQFGKLNDKTGKYTGLKVDEARTTVVADLKELGLLIKEEPYEHNVIACYKCGRVLEPRVIPQWFVKMEPLAKPALKAVYDGDIKIIPDFSKKIFTNWLDNIRDWNISRQIAWGIQIPAKICPKCDFGVPDLENKKTTCGQCGSELVQDPDTFDTWFSSGQWPFATLGYPENKDYKNFYPTAVMETGADILFFWVARMIMLGLYRTNQIPFHTVYLHGMVRDGQGLKMSKSKGNVINPIEIVNKYGADALRMALVIGNTPGTAMALAEDKIKAYKHFSNKLWNISRFILSYAPTDNETPTEANLLKEFNELATAVTNDLENYRFYLAGEKIYHYAWHRLADEIIEESKAILATPGEVADTRRQTLRLILGQTLKLLHPFMPFVTEELWQIGKFSTTSSLLIVEDWPHQND